MYQWGRLDWTEGGRVQRGEQRLVRRHLLEPTLPLQRPHRGGLLLSRVVALPFVPQPRVQHGAVDRLAPDVAIVLARAAHAVTRRLLVPVRRLIDDSHIA